MEKKVYKTKQRETIISIFNENKANCFSSKEIIDQVKGAIGEATVYRLLIKLCNEGLLRKYVSEDNKGSLYRLNDCQKNENCNHFHLRCSNCGDLVHMDCHAMAEISEHIKSKHGFLIDNAKTVLYGQCAKCAKQKG